MIETDTSTHIPDSRPVTAVNADLSECVSTIVTNDSTVYDAWGPIIGSDSTTFIDRDSSIERTIPSRTIHHVNTSNNILGSLEGLLIGGLGFPLVDYGLGSIIVPNIHMRPSFILATGAITGVIIGSIAGHTTRYEMPPRSDDTSTISLSSSSRMAVQSTPLHLSRDSARLKYPNLLGPIDQRYFASDQDYLIVPTVKTIPMGHVAVSDMDIVMVNVGIGLTPSTQVNIMTVPWADLFDRSMVLGLKQSVWQTGSFGTAALAYHLPHLRQTWVGPLLSYGTRTTITIGGIYELSSSKRSLAQSTIPFLGLKFDTGHHGAVIIESVAWAASAGFRAYGDHVAFDAGLYFPLWAHDSYFAVVPFIKLLLYY